MNFILDTYQFHPKCIYFLDKRKNNVINGIFTKILYSTEYFSMTGIYFPFSIFSETPPQKEMATENTWTSVVSNKDNIIYNYMQKLCGIEEQLLELYQYAFSANKIPVFSLKTQLAYGSIKIYRNEDEQYNTDSLVNIIGSVGNKYILKISGIWENATHYGITFKIINL